MPGKKDNNDNYTVADVVFEPGSRNNRHTHYAGQILLVTGVGKKASLPDYLVKTMRLLFPGTSNTDIELLTIAVSSIIAITSYTEKDTPVWLNPLMVEEYSVYLNTMVNMGI